MITDNKCTYLDTKITDAEIYNRLKKIKNNKSPGSDLISNEFLKNLPQNSVLYIYVLFNKILTEERIPDCWTNINLRMIYKKGDNKNPVNYRPIALVNSILKLFTQVIYNRLYEWTERKYTP